MKCPKCGKDMELGVFINRRGDAWFPWVPKSFTEKHWFNVGCHTKKAFEAGGGIVIKAYSYIDQSATSFCCRECRLFLADDK